MGLMSWPFKKLVLPSRGLCRRTHLVPKNKRTFHAGDHDVGRAVAVEILHHELRAHTGTVVNQLRDEFGTALSLGITNGPVPVEDCRAIGIGIEVTLEMGVEPF